ncbi:MAG: NUDIX hydrolase [Kordiimonadaceae bacterium]|nr:NUDIX hydrolase [Kordiimonadaceae bacterium]MBO6569088.1 NUDIX hydrolase [Kordiimonadaceae bacterium]MBO6964563.1 NUDIX hydrolase [Kordiimonadaceae bacterium]
MSHPASMPNRPTVGAGAVVLKGEEVLLIRRGKAPRKGEWSLPGGSVELGETTEAATVREVKEETGLDVELGSLLDVINYIDKSEGSVRHHYVLVDYLAFWRGGEPVGDSDALEARFFTAEEALALPLWSETKRIIRMALDRI